MAAAAIRSVSGGVQHQRPPGVAVLDLRVAEIRQLFDSMDPAPFRERDLDPKAADYIVGWAEETRRDEALALVVHLTREPVAAGDAALPGDAVREYFRGRAIAKRRELSQLFKVGRISLIIGLAFLAGAIAVADALSGLISHEGYASLLKESLIIGGWVALWRPMEIFLYDWWPIRKRARLYDRLAAIELSLRGPADAAGSRS